MELQALLVLCGIGVAGVAVVLLMGLFSASGTSYEEAIAQQRRAATELLALADGKNKPKKSNKKANKKLAKKEKREATLAGGSEPESEAPAESGVEDEPAPETKPHVEFSPPVVVDVQRDSPINIKLRKRGKDPKVKPILVNKEDPSCVSDVETLLVPTDCAVVNHFEEMHPKDEFELMHPTLAGDKANEKKEEVVEKKEAKPVKQAKANKPAKPEPVKEETLREKSSVVEPPKEQRKAKKPDKKSSEENSDSSREETVPPLNPPQPTELTTDKLLRQVAAASTVSASPPPKGKKKKPEPNVLSLMAAGDGGGVNVGELVRVVRDAALSRTEIQILTDALLNKHHESLPEHSEWSEGPNDPMMKLKKQLADKEKALADEIEASQAIQAKLKELRTTLNAERGRTAAAARSAEAAAAAARAEMHTLQARLQRVVDDNHMLQSKLGVEAEAQSQVAQLNLHIQRLSTSEDALMHQLSVVQSELNAHVMELNQARLDAAAARDALLCAQQHVADLTQQLQDANHAYAEVVEQQRQHAAHGEQRAHHEQRQAHERIDELQNEVQRLTSRAQAADAENQKLKEEVEKQKQLASELSSLRETLAARETELAEARQLRAAPAVNGLPANSDANKAALAKVESVVEALRGELAAAQSASAEQRDQLAALTAQLKQHQDKNNELRTKNWKVMEALQSAEKALQTKASALPAQESLREAISKAEETQFNEVANILRAACPAAAPASTVNRNWLHTFADNLKKELQKQPETTGNPVPDSRVADLTAQNEHLQGLVDKYKGILDDTEGVLSRLQTTVMGQEAHWAQQLAEKQRELDELRARTVLQMQKKIDGLQAELKKATAGNHTSFADSERLAEERLMVGGLSDKRNTNACNGPLQVDLEEK